MSRAVAEHLDGAAMQVDEALDERKPNAEPTFGAGMRVLNLREHREYIGECRRGKPNTVVLDRDPQHAVVDSRRERDSAGRVRVLRGVGQKIRQNLCEAYRVRIEARDFGRQVDG